METVAAANTLQAIAEQAMQLSPAERADLSELLWDSVHPVTEPASTLHPEWHAEIERRIAQVDAGQVKFMSGDEAMAELRAHVLRQRPA